MNLRKCLPGFLLFMWLNALLNEVTFNLDRNILGIEGLSDRRRWTNIITWVEQPIRFQFNSNVYFQWDTSKPMLFLVLARRQGLPLWTLSMICNVTMALWQFSLVKAMWSFLVRIRKQVPNYNFANTGLDWQQRCKECLL